MNFRQKRVIFSTPFRKGGIFLTENMLFFLGQKMKDDLSKEKNGKIIFSVYMYKCYKYNITLVKKNQR